MEAPEQTTLDFTNVPHIFGVPRYLYRKALRALRGWMRDSLRPPQTSSLRARAVALLLRRDRASALPRFRSRGQAAPSGAAGHDAVPNVNAGAPAITPGTAPQLYATVLICTYNRAAFLARTLDSLAPMPADSGFSWDVLVVDNNSSDDTRDGRAVARRAASPSRCAICSSRVRESRTRSTPGSPRLAGRDHRRSPTTMSRSSGTGSRRRAPLRRSARHRLHRRSGPTDLGRAASGVARRDRQSLAARSRSWTTAPSRSCSRTRTRRRSARTWRCARALIARIGGFGPDLGRNGESLLGQEQAEFFCRSREVGARGLYVPAMALGITSCRRAG